MERRRRRNRRKKQGETKEQVYGNVECVSM